MKIKPAVFLLLVAAIAIGFWFFATRPPEKPKKQWDPWVLETTEPDTEYGTYLGNGYISTRVKAEGIGVSDGGYLPCYLAGFYDNDYIKPIPTWSALVFYTSPKMRPEDRFLLDSKAPYRQRLNMRDGILETWCTLRNKRWRLNAHILLFVSRQDEQLAGLRFAFRSSKSGPVWMAHLADGKVAADSIICELAHPEYRMYYQVVRSGSSGQSAAVAEKVRGTVNGGRLMERVVDSRTFTWSFHIEKHHEYRLDKLMYVRRLSPMEAGSRGWAEVHLGLELHDVGAFDDVLRRHRHAWRALWKEHDIIIHGDPEAQQVIHSNMFYVLQSARPGGDWSIAPMGLSSDAWGAQVFWDADAWIFPALLPQFPDYARPMLDYRFKTLAQAKLNARAAGYQGAGYTWQSGYTGKEMAPEPYRHGRHVAADVAQAYWQYYLLTGDKKWLAEKGYPVIRATAEYWASRATYNPKRQRYEIKRVVGPDELAEIVDNSAYTNAMARKNLEIAIEVSRLLGKSAPGIWRRIAQSIWIPYDPIHDRYIEYEGYAGKPTKQADTELLIFPVGLQMSKQTKANTFDFWSAKVKKNNPAMSDSMFAVICCDLGRRNQAYSHFLKSYRPYLRGPFNYFNEKESRTYENMCFLTGCAGSIQSVLYGFAGIRIGAQEFGVKPLLPERWRRLEVKGLQLRGSKFDLVVTKGDKWKLSPAGEACK